MRVSLARRLSTRRPLILDGSMGALVISMGVKPVRSVCLLNLEAPETILDIHRRYVSSGAEVILTNTFESNPDHYARGQYGRVVSRACVLARQAAAGRAYVAGDVGPLGILVEPFGDCPFDGVFRRFSVLARLFSKKTVDLIFIESFTSMIEARAAFLALEATGLPIVVSGAFQDDGRTACGDCPEAWAVSFEKLGAVAVGANCTEPKITVEVLRRMRSVTNLPLVAKPNAGVPKLIKGRTTFSLGAGDLAAYYDDFLDAGATMIGGCCGSTPEYISIISRKKGRTKRAASRRLPMIASSRAVLEIGHDEPTRLVGERLNPSGRQSLRAALAREDFQVYGNEALLQEEAGADALDVNVSSPGLDERKNLYQAVLEIYKKASRPLFIDTQNFDAAAAVLRMYPGIAVLNSIPARPAELGRWLPLVRKYGARAVISLVGRQLPKNLEERLENLKTAEKAVRRAGLSREDVIIDPLVYAISTDRDAADTVLRSLAAIRRRGYFTVLGISNISFGLPARHYYNASLIAGAVHAGATFVIANPLHEGTRSALHAARALFQGWLTDSLVVLRPGYDESSRERPLVVDRDLEALIVRGDSGGAVRKAQLMLEEGTGPLAIIERHLGAALKVVGEKYEHGEYYLPQLLAAGEAAKAVIAVVKTRMPAGRPGRGRILLATVEGDIHDIGKNIVKTILESGGYEVIDLGKNKSKAEIVRGVKKYRPHVLGLSALMTTTMPQMAEVVHEIRRLKLKVRVMIGGAPTDDGFAREIGAVYAKDAVSALKAVDRLMKDVSR